MKPTKGTTERLLAEAEVEKAIDEVTSMSKEELQKELADAGFDMKEEDERIRAFLAEKGVRPAPAPPAKVVPLAGRRRGGASWALALAAAAVAILAIGYAWRSKPRPGDDVANGPHGPQAPPSTAPSSPTPGLDIRGNPTGAPIEQRAATGHDCTPIPERDDGGLADRPLTLQGTLKRTPQGFVLALDERLCGVAPGYVRLPEVDVDPSDAKLAPLVGRHVRIDGRVNARDGGGIVVRVDRATGL